MKNKKIIFSSIIILIFVLTILITNYINSNGKVVLVSGKEQNKSYDVGTFSYMLETSAGSGEYQISTDSAWPSGYEYNATLSKCENGGILTWNDETKSVNLKTNVSDKCYLYFDAPLPPDVTLATNYSTITANTPATLNCSNATANYNQKYGRVEISSINNKYTSCTLTYQTPSSKNYLNTYITSLSGTTQGDGQVVSENGYRYEGKNPNNYIWFNNELWRIIGVFDEASHGQSGKNLVKIMRADSIGGLAWHKSNTNDWTASSLMNLLNGAYLNAQDGTDSGYCYGSSSVPSNCDYTNTGISATYRNMIANVKWYLGGYSGTSATAEAFYGYERGTTVYSGRPTEWQGKIGLMYPSDYGYSVLSSSCARTTNLGSYNTTTCAGESWLYGEGIEWTITPNSSSSYYVFRLNYDGYLINNRAYLGYPARPVLYLDSSVYVIDGNGTMGDAYIIGM